MSEHTPGPWTTNHSEHDAPYQDIKIKTEHRTVATVWIDDAPVHDYNAEQEANAKLIAAAPDLLAVCELFLERGVYNDQMLYAVRKAKGMTDG